VEKQYTNVDGEFKPNPMYWVPNKVILDFFQNWGQSLQERADALNEAIELAGFEGVKAQANETGWAISGSEGTQDLFKEFYQELKSCFPKGQFEWEEEAVRQVIMKYQKLNGVYSPKNVEGG